MMRLIAKPTIALGVILSLLTLNLSSLNLPQARVSAQTNRRASLSQLATEPRTFERKDKDGNTLARLQVSSADSSNRLQFLIEDLQTEGKVDGTVEVADGGLKVRFIDGLNKQRLGMDVRSDPLTPGRSIITLLHNKRQCEVTIDGARAREVASRMREFTDQGKQDQAKQLIPLIRQTFSGADKYLAFAKKVASSPAFGMLSTTAALQASLSSEVVHKNMALHVIGLAVTMLAPAGAKSAGEHGPHGTVGRAQRPLAPKVRHDANTVSRAAVLNFAAQDNCVCCGNCVWAFFGMLFGCIDFWLWCLDWDEQWVCDLLAALCVASAYGFFEWCTHDYCGSCDGC
jgi:hypothetical protein